MLWFEWCPQKDIADFIKILNEKRIYKSVSTDKVERIIIDDKENKQGTYSAPSNTSTNNKIVSNTQEDVSQNSNVANDDGNETDIENKLPKKSSEVTSISAKVDFTGNDELSRSINGYLNSIIRVVVR